MSQYMKAGYTPPKAPKKPKKPSNKPQMTQRSVYPPQVQQPPQRPAAPKPPKKEKIKRPLSVRILRALAAVLALCVAAALTFVGLAYREMGAYKERYYPGVYVGNVHLGGLTREQATTALKSRMDEQLQAYQIEVVHENGQKVRTVLPQDVSLAYDLETQMNEAWKVARSGNLIEQMQAVRRVRVEPEVFDWTITYDAQKIEELASALAAQIDCDAVDAQASFKPLSAQSFVFADEQIGAKLDQEDLAAQLTQRLSSLSAQTVTLNVSTQTPEITRAQLEKNVSLRARIFSDVSVRSGDNRSENIRLAAERLNGVMLKPGETFDFNAIVGKRTAAAGYLDAQEPAYGEDVSGVGGGVCQVSTALYQAVLTAGLKVEEHHPHMFPVDYAPAGQDATVSDQGLNLTFANNTAYPVYIKTRFYEAQDDVMRLEVTLFGAPQQAVYTLESVIEEEIPIPEPIRVRDKEQTYVKYTDEEKLVGEGRVGYVAQNYRIAWVDGVETGREPVAQSTYQPIAPRIYVGMTEREGGK